jgi:hypothetical protein
MFGGDLNESMVLVKTAKGHQEVDQRRYGLSQELRHVLIMVDGRRTVGQLLNTGHDALHAARALPRLIEQGFVAPREGPPTAVPAGKPGVKGELAKFAGGLLGAHGARVIAQIDKCSDDSIALAGCVDSCFKLIKLTIDERKADQFVAGARQILERMR